MVGWQHRVSGQELAQTPGHGEGQGGLACCGSWGRKELYMTERLYWTEFIMSLLGMKYIYDKPTKELLDYKTESMKLKLYLNQLLKCVTTVDNQRLGSNY